ncbi:hypothetical protein LOTGIDRAFT_222314 [Lottia gigantea]|uniref:Peptidase M1 leukotriene A4 hydrolase/aminopeptidase C-terminal domain-containing protein n=1 Tax=Lottia gigantea TaxID=225164 RepID=V3ZSM9_LOTGI|nr:hypothetical protein LOTGIDRAFT_222314 [Lottia gigantea]ESO83886.1 hypothetical protein LOTGIDRAFT_222314 [Lottia gigantea]
MRLHSDSATDVATASNFREIKVSGYHFDFDVDFDRREIKGQEVLSCSLVSSAEKKTKEVILDVHQTLQVIRVGLQQNDTDLKFEIKPFTDYGTALHIQIPESKLDGSEFKLWISFIATGGTGVCWLDPLQTAGKVKPYLYTQGQAACNRSFFPCQDTPAVKTPYTANVKIPEGFTAVMSASESSYGNVPNLTGNKNTYYFSLKQPVQCYLIALAVGDIQSANIGPRSKVWAEPSVLEKAKNEFNGVVEEFINTGERLFGPYVWDKYDILIMPPSFPFGGMENPCLTFVTPCLLVGDKSLTDVVIHEITHSWFGNLVTNATWSEFWLNEGFTMFGQRRIMEEIFGKAYTCLEAQCGLALLKQHIDDSGQDHPLNRLRVVIEPGVDPDDTYNETPYEKGYSFVCYLQHMVGDVHKFDDFLKSYVDKYKFKSVVAEDMFDYYVEYFPELKGKIDFDAWLNVPGWPTYVPDLSAGQELTEPAEKLAAVLAGESNETVDRNIEAWKTYQIFHLLDKLLERSHISHDRLQFISKTYPNISQSQNSEILLRWGQIVIKNDFQPAFPTVRNFLNSQGKQKYTLPIYKALVKGSETAQNLATTIFNETQDTLHINVRNYVQKILAGN